MLACGCHRLLSSALYQWRYRDLDHAHSVHLVALTSQDFYFVHELLSLKERFFVLPVCYLFLNHFFFSLPLPSLCSFCPLPPSTSSALLLRLPLSLLPHIRLSSFPKPSYSQRCTADGLRGSCLCRTAMSALACLCKHLLS